MFLTGSLRVILTNSLTHSCWWDLTEVTLADKYGYSMMVDELTSAILVHPIALTAEVWSRFLGWWLIQGLNLRSPKFRSWSLVKIFRQKLLRRLGSWTWAKMLRQRFDEQFEAKFSPKFLRLMFGRDFVIWIKIQLLWWEHSTPGSYPLWQRLDL